MRRIAFHQANLAKHAVDIDEAEEALLDGWRDRARNGDNYEVLGQTGEGRYLQLIVEVTPDSIRVFHGRDMTTTERRRYKKK